MNLLDRLRKKEKKSLQISEEKTRDCDSSAMTSEMEDIRQTDGWVSPSYSQCRNVNLNLQKILDNRCVGYLNDSHESESYKILRTHILQKTGGHGGITIMITSAMPGEGKTLTAVNLSLTVAKQFNQTVLLVDSDLHQQKIHEYLGYESSSGLADYLISGAPLSDLIVWPGVEKLTVISGGQNVVASSELLSSPRMKDLVKELKSRYPERYVIFDVPPVLSGADVLAFAPQVDYIIMVVRAGSTSLNDVKRALAFLPKDKILGIVFNRAETSEITRDYYGAKKKEKQEARI